ncbi:hypothetical protein H4582DRAFT_1937826, partial [Lactarius indigo]
MSTTAKLYDSTQEFCGAQCGLLTCVSRAPAFFWFVGAVPTTRASWAMRTFIPPISPFPLPIVFQLSGYYLGATMIDLLIAIVFGQILQPSSLTQLGMSARMMMFRRVRFKHRSQFSRRGALWPPSSHIFASIAGLLLQ